MYTKTSRCHRNVNQRIQATEREREDGNKTTARFTNTGEMQTFRSKMNEWHACPWPRNTPTLITHGSYDYFHLMSSKQWMAYVGGKKKLRKSFDDWFFFFWNFFINCFDIFFSVIPFFVHIQHMNSHETSQWRFERKNIARKKNLVWKNVAWKKQKIWLE